jgi:hypothetical protein
MGGRMGKGYAHAMDFVAEEMAAWPKGTKAWQAIEAARTLDTLPASQRPLPKEC